MCIIKVHGKWLYNLMMIRLLSQWAYFKNCGLGAYDVKFSMQCLTNITDLTYCSFCFNVCEHLFGCTGLKKKKYCILNKQYSEEEYYLMVDKIIAHMKVTGEWGQFFPIKMSSVAYGHGIVTNVMLLRLQQFRSHN